MFDVQRNQSTETRAQSPFMLLFIADAVLISHNSNDHFQMTHTIRLVAAFIAYENSKVINLQFALCFF